jgi:hypothetical protein
MFNKREGADISSYSTGAIRIADTSLTRRRYKLKII